MATLTGVYHLSRGNTKLLLREVWGIELSVGAISQMEPRVRKSLQPASEEAHAEVVAALVKHTDATTWLKAGMMMSLWLRKRGRDVLDYLTECVTANLAGTPTPALPAA